MTSSWWLHLSREGFTSRCQQEVPRMSASKVYILPMDRPNSDLTLPKKQKSRAKLDDVEAA